MIACVQYQLQIHCYIFLLLSVAGTPTGVTANRTGYTSVLVSWFAPSPPPAGYEVFYQTSAVNSSRLSGGSDTELTLTGLTIIMTYTIFVVGFGKEGAAVLPSSRSNAVMITLCESLQYNYCNCYVQAILFIFKSYTHCQLLKSHS